MSKVPKHTNTPYKYFREIAEQKVQSYLETNGKQVTLNFKELRIWVRIISRNTFGC